jgi:hypothetical protein
VDAYDTAGVEILDCRAHGGGWGERTPDRRTRRSLTSATSMMVDVDDDAAPAPGDLLSYPAPTIPDELNASSASTSTSASRQLVKDRLYVGNLHPSVDE